MNKFWTYLLLLLLTDAAHAQITTPVVKANFGVDAEQRSNQFGALSLEGIDDWFVYPGTIGTGEFVIDTTGAAAIVSRYATDIPYRSTSFYRGMRFPVLSRVNNHLLLDALFFRDFHGTDSTVFGAGGNKNGFSPADWTCPVAQSVPDKNDILDVAAHVRREGPDYNDSLWLFGSVSLDNITGNRYFDFEMYQSNLVYDRTSRTFSGYGPDAGHVSWQFDASGNVVVPGDIIFSAEFQSSTLTNIEARIWVHQSALLIDPATFDWAGSFNGASAGAQYGYASIRPNAAGAYYTGLTNTSNSWGGPFGIILQDNSLTTDYIPQQYMEFSVNLTKLGLDPAASITANVCGMPFRSLMVKTRASASFTADLKDFIAPVQFFEIPQATLATGTPSICQSGSWATIDVTNPLPTSVYEWSTLDGNITSSTQGTSITVDQPGTYIVEQYLVAGCETYATDTIEIALSSGCIELPVRILEFSGQKQGNAMHIRWHLNEVSNVREIELQRRMGEEDFQTSSGIQSPDENLGQFIDQNTANRNGVTQYRLKVHTKSGQILYSSIIAAANNSPGHTLTIYPNPSRSRQVSMQLFNGGPVQIFQITGQLVWQNNLVAGSHTVDLSSLAPGTYFVRAGQQVQKLILH